MDPTEEAAAALAVKLVAALRRSGARVEADPQSLTAVRIDGACDFLLLARTAIEEIDRRTDESIPPEELNASNDE
jgi:hypothetical protein